jgi:hypothetical protein
MQKLIQIIQDIEVSDDRDFVASAFLLLLEEIKKAISTLEQCKSFSESMEYFDILQKANECVGEAQYIHDLKTGSQLWKFYKDFDRADDARQRKILYDKIRSGKYSFKANHD